MKIKLSIACGLAGAILSVQTVFAATPWTLFAHPNAPAYNSTQITGVAAVSDANAWAVGTASSGSAAAGFISHWNGSSWHFTRMIRGVHLNAVASSAANNVWAVGSDDITGRALALHFDGLHWKSTFNANGAVALVGVSAPGGADVWAAGVAAGDRPFVEHWDGTSWIAVAEPVHWCCHNTSISGIAAVSATDVWIVGNNAHFNFNHIWRGGFFQHWDGTTWTYSDAPKPGYPHFQNFQFPMLFSISAAAGKVWAVGDVTRRTDGGATTLTEPYTAKWNGLSWQYVAPAGPFLATTEGRLNATVVAQNGDVWAVGSNLTGGGSTPLAEVNHGGSWTFSGMTTPAGAKTNLVAVSFAPEKGGWAVGSEITAATARALVERHV